MRWQIWVVCFGLGVATAEAFPSEATPLQQALAREFQTFFETGQTGRILKNVAKELNLADVFFETWNEEKWPEPRISLFCSTCATGINQLLKINDLDVIVAKSIELCIQFGLGTRHVCEGLITSNAAEATYIIKNTPGETGNDICGVMFVGRGCTSRNPDRVWEVALPDVPKPVVHETPYPQQTDVPTMKILHLADTHYDPYYAPGSPIFCEEKYLCCRDTGAPPANPNEAAGFWGSYGACDIPKWTLAAMYDYISKVHTDIDFIIWTGDLIPHSVWETSKEGNVAIMHEMADLISEYFPGVPVYPSVGNHEGNPVNQFSQPYITDPQFSMTWMYDELASIWGRWLPEAAAKNISYGAYYSVQVKPGLRVLSVNTNYCYAYNWWLIHDSTDIANELDLLAKELQKSEDNEEMVYIVGHMPSGASDCSLTWSNQFNKIVARYESTISGMFYAHTHKDHFEIFFDPENKDRAYEVAYIAQSQTTYSDLNPGYKIYTVEGDFDDSRYRVLDHDNYILDLILSNAVNETNFAKLYSAKQQYELPDLSPESWYQLVLEMNKPNSSYFDLFYRNYIKAGAPHLIEGCNNSCKNGILCDLLISDNSDHSKCKELEH